MFYVGNYRGEVFGGFRMFVKSPNYTGFTRKGVHLKKAQINSLISSLQVIKSDSKCVDDSLISKIDITDKRKH